jgi:exodeoxyribonuclease V alpha subunit
MNEITKPVEAEAVRPQSDTAPKGVLLEQLDTLQRTAVERALDVKRRITATTGPAGSGKTTVMRFIYEQLVEAGYNPVICAPTGKAARRVREATGAPAMTIHMLLKYTAPQDINPKTGKPYGATFPRHTRENPIEYDCVICDEYAMVPHELHRNLLDAFPPGCRLIVFGDISQLPPIETNATLAAKPTAFQDLLTRFEGVYLERVHRQAGDSGILSNAQRILKGASPQKKSDFNMIITDRPIDAMTGDLHPDWQATLDEADFASLRNQVLTPSNKSWVGTHKLNALLQGLLMPDGRATIDVPRRSYQGKTFDPPLRVGVGDKVVMTKNWYDLECEDGSKGLFNGEVGKVIEITDLHEIVVDFEDRICRIPPAVQVVWNNKVLVLCPQQDLYLAYAMTTHKAQGSEYEHVIYVINKSVQIMLNRKNLYTAITRARKKVTLIADMRSLSLAVTNKEPRVFGE